MSNVNGVGSRGGLPSSEAAEIELSSTATSLLRYGSAEAAVAMAAVSLDEQRQNARAAERRSRQDQARAQLERVDAMRDAVDARLVAGVIAGVTQAAAGAFKAAGGVAGGEAQLQGQDPTAVMSEYGGQSEVVAGYGKIASTIFEFEAGKADIRATKAQQRADMREAQAQENAEDVRGAEQLSEKAFGHLDRIAQARMDARLASSRG